MKMTTTTTTTTTAQQQQQNRLRCGRGALWTLSVCLIATSVVREFSAPTATTTTRTTPRTTTTTRTATVGGGRVESSSLSLSSKLLSPFLMPPARRCYTDRFHGYWDADQQLMRSFDPVCDRHLRQLVLPPETTRTTGTSSSSPPPPVAATTTTNTMATNTTATNITATATKTKATDAVGAEEEGDGWLGELAGSCVLLLGDSTDRHVIENWCPRWKRQGLATAMELWLPRNRTDGFLFGVNQQQKLDRKIRDNGGWRCSPGNRNGQSFTIGNIMHYGVGPPPYWQYAHLYLPNVPTDLDWGNSTWERVATDLPKFFADCAAAGHTRHNFVIVQSYLWDLARQHHVHGTGHRPPPAMLAEWAHNATRLVAAVRAAAPKRNTQVAWRFHGPVPDGDAWDAQAIYDMNLAWQAARPDVDFVTDYGAVLASTLASVHNRGPFYFHPPPVAQTAYLNLLLNALVAFATDDDDDNNKTQ
jgi:hypothetical protein